MKPSMPDRRLLSAAELVRRGSVAADIGTDHAYLPIYLVSRGICPRAVASDINKLPLERAKKNIAAAGLSDRIETVLTDGLQGIESRGVDDIIICGMGGELIASILDSAPWIKREKIRLTLQPMTHPEKLRAYLLSSGFEILDETLSGAEGEKIYQTLCAEHTGTVGGCSDLELLLGRHNIARGGALLCELAARYAEIFEARLAGKQKSGADTAYEKSILDGLLALGSGRK